MFQKLLEARENRILALRTVAACNADRLPEKTDLPKILPRRVEFVDSPWGAEEAVA